MLIAEETNYEYDAFHRLSGAEFESSPPIRYHYDALGNIIEAESGQSFSGPDIVVTQDAVTIPMGGSYVFGAQDIGSVETVTFTIINEGDVALDLPGIPRVAIDGDHKADFNVGKQPSSQIAPGSQSTFSISFSPTGPGLRTATVGIWNTDPGENPYEFDVIGSSAASPTVGTQDAAQVTHDSAVLEGTINPNGSAASYYFEYGLTTGYGNQTASASAGSGTGDVSVSASITGLEPGKTYHFRLVGENLSGRSLGDDMVFITPAVYTLSIQKVGACGGTVTSSPAGIDCGDDCTEPYDGNTIVTLTAIPDAGCKLTGWSGDDCTGTDACIVTMDADTTVTATFDIKLTNDLPVSDPGGPYAAVAGQSIALDASGSIDPDGAIVLYEWDIDNDGTYDYESALPSQSHTYAQAGDYTIKLRVTDNDGATDEAVTTATISESFPAIYVDRDAPGNNDGSSWNDAFNHLQDALSPAQSGDVIRVAEGVYRPDESGDFPDGTGDRAATFQLKEGVALYGGYAGYGHEFPDTRDVAVYETVLSGDPAENDGPDFENNNENNYHVVSASNVSVAAILDGFTVTGGNSNARGGGMINTNSSPTVANCIFYLNAAEDGGGMYNYDSSPTVSNCTFLKNYVEEGDGGGMYNNSQSSPALSNCTFIENNAAADDGGGMFNNSQSNPTLTNCTFYLNTSGEDGGGMFNSKSNPTLTNCTFYLNTSGEDSGGVHNYYSSPTLTNCTFSENTAALKGGGMKNTDCTPTLINCIFWGNTAGSNPQISGEANATYCDIQGGWAGEGNISADPLFVNPAGNDLHLQSGSPCIDAGDNNAPGLPETDFEGDQRIVDGDGDGTAIVDMGVDEHTPSAVEQYTITANASDNGTGSVRSDVGGINYTYPDTNTATTTP
ncbi:MAG: choice-of-anchor D domain-containing protein, partial [Deltaproteobacteria bacterium]|nr:choice-of-anchor D domain-containing protein [Deltaproteobacteria bacterium]